MPFHKRTILPAQVCRPATRGSRGGVLARTRQDCQAQVFLSDLTGVCGFSLCSLLLQLSDLSRHTVNIVDELQEELTCVCRRSCALELRVAKLQKRVTELLSRPPTRAVSGLDSDRSSRRLVGSSSSSSSRTSDRGGGGAAGAGGGGVGGSGSSVSSISRDGSGPSHFRSPWQQSVNVFGAWSRPECVEELHQEAQLNLQSLLQGEGGGRRGGGGGGKFHGVDLLQHSPSPSPSPGEPFPHQPHSLEPVSESAHQNLPLRKTHSDLDSSSSAADKTSQNQLHPDTMDHSGLLCSSSSWNGPKGSTFSPGVWNESYAYSSNKGPAVPPKQHTIIGHTGGALQGDAVMLVRSGHSMSSHSSSFTSVTESSEKGGNAMPVLGKRSETEGAAADGGRGGGGGAGGGGEVVRGRERSARSIAAQNAFKFRERSLSTPTDSGSFCFTDSGMEQPDGNVISSRNGNAFVMTDHHENYALLYPRGSSEDSASTADTISVAASDYSTEGRLRIRSRSISLKKSKRKPPPPVRSVSLMKNIGEAEGRIHSESRLYRDGRPKSLHIPREHFPDFQPDFLLPSCSKSSGSERDLVSGGNDGPPSLEVQAPEGEGETDLAFSTHWQLGEWKNDPYRSLSGSSTATGTTVIECMKVRGSSESLLDSPSTSRATSPSQLSTEHDHKASSPFKPPGLMSPSSGYSSQSETPTSNIPLNQAAGPGPTGTLGCKMRPKIPERKSSLPSPKDPNARSRLSFEMPGSAHLELSSIKPKQKASRRHSDTSTAAKPGKNTLSSSQALPVVTQNELKTVRLRSVPRSDLEDCPDGASDTIEEEQHGRELCEDPSPPPTLPKPKPPVAVKPPLPKRPMNLLLKSSSPSSTSPLAPDSPPSSPVDRPVPLGNIYKVMKKPKPKKPPPQTSGPSGLVDYTSTTIPMAQAGYDHALVPNSLCDLPPLPDPQPLLEDPMLEPEFEADSEICLRPEEGGSLPSPCSNQEIQEFWNKSKTLPPRMTMPCMTEFPDRKKAKVPPPVPKKPNVLLLPTAVQPSTNGSTDRQMPQADSPVGLRFPVESFPLDDVPSAPSFTDFPELEVDHMVPDEESSKESSLQSSLQDSSLTELEAKMDTTRIQENDSSEKTVLHIAEDTDDDFLASTPATHTTEDLFTIIHRSKRKVLGRKEPPDSFGSRQSLVSPVKHSSGGNEYRNMTLGSSQRSSSRNENFMALLQKKGSKSSSGGARVSAMELLKSTNPLARRVTEFSNTSFGAEEAETGSGIKPNDQ
uniref:NHS-like 2 n=1 Tax=Cynoglossus semilaevis TaxID=244447 RepID=A0A3P8UK03_CYNSE